MIMEANNGVSGYIHSVESFGGVDGPGVRYIVFLQGCPLRCIYCHNPDSRKMSVGILTNSASVAEEIEGYIPFIKNGGVTLSGGEPLAQPEFAADILRRCKDMGLHTALDTSGYGGTVAVLKVLKYTDLVLLDIKAYSGKLYTAVTGMSEDKAKALLEMCEKLAIKVRIRHVVVPGYTDEPNEEQMLARYLSKFNCIDRVEPIPFHKMGEYKWKDIDEEYELYGTPETDEKTMDKVKEIFTREGLKL